MTLEQAEKLFADFFRSKPRIKDYIDRTHEFVKQNGYIETLQGLRRNLRNIYSQDNKERSKALRQSVNTAIQGSGAFLTNTSLIIITKFLQRKGLRSKIVLTVHDSIVIDCPPEEVHIVAKAAKYIMENLPIDWLFIEWEGKRLRYPIKADVEIGLNYNDMVNYDAEDLSTFNSIGGYCRFYNDKKKLKSYYTSKQIDEDKYKQLVETVENKKDAYRAVA